MSETILWFYWVPLQPGWAWHWFVERAKEKGVSEQAKVNIPDLLRANADEIEQAIENGQTEMPAAMLMIAIYPSERLDVFTLGDAQLDARMVGYLELAKLQCAQIERMKPRKGPS